MESIKPTVEQVKAISIQLGMPVDLSDEELQADIDDFFDTDSAKKYEKENAEEVAHSRAIFEKTINLLQSDEFWRRSWKDHEKCINTCAICLEPFMGNKMSVACVTCTGTPTTTQLPPNTDLQKVQDRENRENELFTLESQRLADECPKCDGYGEIFDETDYEEPHKDCPRCFGSGQWYN